MSVWVGVVNAGVTSERRLGLAILLLPPDSEQQSYGDLGHSGSSWHVVPSGRFELFAIEGCPGLRFASLEFGVAVMCDGGGGCTCSSFAAARP